MSVTVQWKSQAGRDIDGIEIYRRTGATATININALGDPLAALPKTATQYVDTTVVDKNIYRYWVVSVKGNNRTLGFPITQGFYLNMGPGPRELKRGTWQYGWFGKVSNQEMFTYQDVRGLVSKLTMFSANPDYWDKYIFNGAILFIPNKYMGSTTLQALYQAGIVYGTDGNGTYVPPSTTATNQLTKISKGEFEFIIRLPRINGTGQLSSMASFNGEVRATMARMLRAQGTGGNTVMDGKMDCREPTSTTSLASREVSWCANTYTTNTYFALWDGVAPEWFTYGAYNQNYPFIPVFELVQP